ncbi:Heparinase II/III-like protein [Roseovarius albus]|uniref:Heparinase II/III-like protein n=1 Tax=Roseovarius albus TaxID=1247867 RepID=A0A1X6ZVJ9_9RHOB|nr:heparinase II/III family protein [Roseovarius albus]SLN63097.1 Heparinase II/III-like protein [Roseovarius albus]
MTYSDNLSINWARWMNRLAARRVTLSRPATGFVSQPEPRTIGSFAKGRQLISGNFLFAGHLLQGAGQSLWDVASPDESFSTELQGFIWLDDLAAVGDTAARKVAQDWLWQWIALYGHGAGSGWTPELTGRRLIRWINHAIFLLRGQEAERSTQFYRSLGQQTLFLERRWRASPPGLPRFEALIGLIYAGLSLEGMEGQLPTALKALAKECNVQISEQGGIPTRNPEELLEVFTLLNWTAMALHEAGKTPSDAHRAAIERIAPTLRTLRHADGSLARFHGGGRGLTGRLDHALAESGVKHGQPMGLSMGFARLSAGRTSIIIDAAAPPKGKASTEAHASTLAFELTSGRRPLIVNCGSGRSFGSQWRRAGRATPSHSALVMDGHSSSRLGSTDENRDWLTQVPMRVPVAINPAPDGISFEGQHDGYRQTHGLIHRRKLEVVFDGSGIVGEETLFIPSDQDKRVFDKQMDARNLLGINFDIRFHLHPDVEASLDMGGTMVSMVLKSGEMWLFRTDSACQLKLEPSVYLEKHRLKPRATKQVILSGRAMEYASRIRWSLAKPEDAPVSIRDLVQDDLDGLTDLEN